MPILLIIYAMASGLRSAETGSRLTSLSQSVETCLPITLGVAKRHLGEVVRSYEKCRRADDLVCLTGVFPWRVSCAPNLESEA